MDNLSALLKDIRDNLASDERLIEQYIRKEGQTPLDVLVERESRRDIVELLSHLEEILDEIDLKILEMFIIDNRTQEYMANVLGISQPAIVKRLNKIPEKVVKFGYKIPHFDNYVGKDFLIKSSTLEVGSPTGCGFPFEYLQKINVGGHWGKVKGKKNKRQRLWVSKAECRLPEYFTKCFGDNETKCPICQNCKREAKK